MTVERAAHPARAASALRASPYFTGLGEASVRQLARAASHRTVPATVELEVEAGPAGTPCLYLLAAGDVSVSTPPERDGVSEVVAHEGPGSAFGSPQITGEEDVRVYHAVGPVEAYVWEQPALERLFGEHEGLRRQIETRLSLRRRRSELVDLLRRTPLFKHSSQSLLRFLVESSTLGWFEPEDVICRQGDEGDSMFLIVSGEVAFYQDEVAGPLRQLHRGDFFGEIALTQHSIRTATAVVVSNSEVLTVGRQAYDVVYRRSSTFRHAVRLTAELRLAADTAGEPDPELVWLVNDTSYLSANVAALVASSLKEVVGQVAKPRRLDERHGVQAMLAAGRRQRAAYVLCFSEGTVDRALGREVADAAGTLVYFTEDPAAPFPYQSASHHRVHHVVVSEAGGSPEAHAVRRDAFTLRALPSEIDGGSLDRLTADTQGALRRIARAIGHQRVGVALGGGAAWGYAHVALLRGLERAQIPIDMIFGVSMGSMVGAFYASQGLDGLDRLVDARLELSAATLAAIGTTSSVDLFLRRHIPERRLEDLALPFATVAVEARTGRERVFRHGSVAAAVRASCSLPGVFGPHILGGRRYLDAAVRNNVPASYCMEADADFVIACDVVPSPRASRDMPSERGLRALLLELSQVNRVTDTVRSLYWLAGDSGRRQATVADALFAPDLPEFYPWDFHRARAIIEKTEPQLDDWLAATQARYRALSRTWRTSG
jgi:predicted acylesterase/phospholipase RssA/CRP-like cAMP-binding protein